MNSDTQLKLPKEIKFDNTLNFSELVWINTLTSSLKYSTRRLQNWKFRNVSKIKHLSEVTADLPVFYLAVYCPTLLEYVVSTNTTYAGSLVNVSCPSGRRFSTIEQTTMLTMCDNTGSWIPSLPFCNGLLTTVYYDIL